MPGWSLAFHENRPFLTKDFWFPAYSVACQAVQEVCQKAKLMIPKFRDFSGFRAWASEFRGLGFRGLGFRV